MISPSCCRPPRHERPGQTPPETATAQPLLHHARGHDRFFNLLKRERIRRKVYRTRDQVRADVFDYIEMFYNPTRKHARNGMLSPVEFKRQHKTQAEGV